jgi:hypothetical protein
MSSSLELDSSFGQLTIEELDTTDQSYRRKRSPAWQYCRRPTEDENQEKLYCVECTLDSDLPLYGTKIAENIKKHLLLCHQIVVKKAPSKNQVAVNHQLRQLWR